MGGLGILFFIVLYIVLSIWLIIRVSKWYWRVLAVLAIVLVPSADGLWGRYVVMPKLCQDAGLKVFKHVSKSDGLMTNAINTKKCDAQKYEAKYSGDICWTDSDFLKETGLSFVEKDFGDEVVRMKYIDGMPTVENNVTPISRYEEKIGVHIALSKNASSYSGQESGIYDRLTGETLSRVRRYYYRGGWAERFLGSFGDAGYTAMHCGPGDHDPIAQNNAIIFETFR